jgi:hypothetical protein
MSKAEKEAKSVVLPHNNCQKRPLEEIGQNCPNAEGIVIPARLLVY